MSIIITEYVKTVVCNETKYIIPKEMRMATGMEQSARISILKLRRLKARIVNGNHNVIISCSGTSLISVCFIARFKNVGPVAEMCMMSWSMFFRSMNPSIVSTKSKALNFILPCIRHIHCKRMPCLS